MTLRGRFDDIAVTSVEPIEGALRANVALTGDLALRYASKRAGKVEPASGRVPRGGRVERGVAAEGP